MIYVNGQRPAIFLDKDGTLVPDLPFNVDPSLITLNKNVVEGLQLLKRFGFLFVVVSNQPGIAHGYFSEQELMPAFERVEELLAEHSIFLSGFYYCPHHPFGRVQGFATECECRKPKAGLFHKAGNDLNIDLSASWMIGDILHDIEAGHAAGCKSVLINNGNETEWILNKERQPEYIAADLLDAATSIINHNWVCVTSN